MHVLTIIIKCLLGARQCSKHLLNIRLRFMKLLIFERLGTTKALILWFDHRICTTNPHEEGVVIILILETAKPRQREVK